jgi:hypothetical protein
MGPLICLACILSFPKPTADDIDEIRRVIEKLYTQERRPWSEVGGPFAKVHLQLLTPDFGVADALVTSVSSIAASSRVLRFVVKRVDGAWTIFRAE